MPIGLEDRLINNASGFSIAGAIDNDIRGIYWVATTGDRDLIGDANTNNSDLRAQYVICIVGSTPYIYTSSSIADPDWTNTSNWQEFALGDLTAETNARIAADNALSSAINVNTNSITQNAGNITTNTGAISNNASGISANAGNIAVNAGNISTNASAISTNSGDITTLQGDLAQEITDRQNEDSALLGQIQSNDTDISNNTSAISSNASAISANSTAISAIVSADGSIDTHSDVDTSTTAPTSGQILVWDTTNWVPADQPASGVVLLDAKNDTGASIPKGTPVYVSGASAQSGKPTIAPADNNGSGTYPAIGLTTQTLADGDEGLYVMAAGTLTGLDTDTPGYSVGDALYLDSSPGALTNSRPTGATNKVQKVALVSRVHVSNGSVIVMGAGRTNDVPNLENGYFWQGNASDVATPANFENSVANTTAVTNNTSKLATIATGATANQTDAYLLSRANHTGTQTASTISDFDTEVSNNTDVLANTAKVSADGLVTTHSDVTSAGSGAIITTAERSKLNGIATGATANPDAIDNVVEDTTPELGGNLNLNGNDIIGSGKIDITGKVTQTDPPTAAGDLTTKSYVDDLIAAGVHYHDPVRVESPDSAGSLNATYNNGTAGVGATLTNAGTQAALVIDGVTLSVSDRVLIYNQTNAYENGLYTVTNVGSPTTNWVLTRATDADSYGLGNKELSEGTSVFVLEGDDGAGEVYVCTTIGNITFGTTAINFSQIGKSPAYPVATQSDDGLMSSSDKTKLDGIAAGAEVNVNADWNSASGDSKILNKPTLGTAAAADTSDFAPAVHTHIAANITDFDTEVSNNTDVAANTLKVSADGSVTTHSDVTNAGSGAIITTAERNKLNGIAAGAEVNVNADWNAASGDAQILNKPTLGTAAAADTTDFAPASHTHTLADITNAGTSAGYNVPATGDAAVGEVVKGDDTRLTDARTPTAHGHPASDITGLATVATTGDSTDLIDSVDLIRDTNTISDLAFVTQPSTGTVPYLGGAGWVSAVVMQSITFTPTTGITVTGSGQSPTLLLTSSDNSVTITGSASTLDFTATGGGGGSSNQRTLTVPAGNGYSGDVVTFGSAPAGGFTVGELYYFANTGAWEEAYGTSVNTSIGLLGICVNTSTPEILIRGIIRSSGYANQFSLGRRLYVSTLQGGSGRFMDSVPGSPPSGAVIRAAGFVTDAVNGVIMFDPSQDYITVT